ncbi:hypothetical protein OG339_47565 (plasmid) [Streptosporangium sp. NBC_01495]|uniref:hypothetical protein n=1 Tax=Streptosporangium sp. NBC_01495 TaxID=2903899 RepID=UPI002E2F61D9|nr:hypothetical protein [Streptosporangium sp. NBC_01495]
MTAEAIGAGMRVRIGKKYTFDVMVKKSRRSTECSLGQRLRNDLARFPAVNLLPLVR